MHEAVRIEAVLHERWSCSSCGESGPWYPAGDRTIEAGRAVHYNHHRRALVEEARRDVATGWLEPARTHPVYVEAFEAARAQLLAELERRAFTAANVQRIAEEATAHNYGRTVYEVHQFGEQIDVRMSSYPRCREAERALIAAGFVAETDYRGPSQDWVVVRAGGAP